MSRGRVILVGAGPGDPELLTLKAMRMLRAADVLLHDDLVSDEVLACANPRARRIAVGKRGGCRSTPQAFIEQLMIREALSGYVVVRLKGGDPFIFGRGGEEIAALRNAGVDVEVVNGITAGVAAPSAAGIPLTHRSFAHGVAFVSGHGVGETREAQRWTALAKSGLTLVIYMGVAHASRIRDRLREAGMSMATPVAMVCRASRPDQRAVVATLRDFVEVACDAGIESPAIIVIGDVAALATTAGARLDDGVAAVNSSR